MNVFEMPSHQQQAQWAAEDHAAFNSRIRLLGTLQRQQNKPTPSEPLAEAVRQLPGPEEKATAILAAGAKARAPMPDPSLPREGTLARQIIDAASKAINWAL